MSPRRDVSEERKEQILDAAAEVFTRKGFDKARMDDIVEETGLSKGALYWYFKSKDDIVFSILDRIFERELAQLKSAGQGELTATERVTRFTDLVAQDVTGMTHLIPIMFEFLALAFRQGIVRRALRRYMRRYMELLVPMFQSGVDSGEFRPVDAHEVAVAAGAIIEGTILLWVYDRSQVDMGRNIRRGIQLLLEGVQARA